MKTTIKIDSSLRKKLHKLKLIKDESTSSVISRLYKFYMDRKETEYV